MDNQFTKNYTKEEIQAKRLKALQDRRNKKEVIVNGKTIELDKVPNYQREYWIKLSEIENSAVKAIKAKCYECSGYSISEANNCNCKDCALWVYRNRKVAKIDSDEIFP